MFYRPINIMWNGKSSNHTSICKVISSFSFSENNTIFHSEICNNGMLLSSSATFKIYIHPDIFSIRMRHSVIVMRDTVAYNQNIFTKITTNTAYHFQNMYSYSLNKKTYKYVPSRFKFFERRMYVLDHSNTSSSPFNFIFVKKYTSTGNIITTHIVFNGNINTANSECMNNNFLRFCALCYN